jgi:uncharacterized membrane protein
MMREKYMLGMVVVMFYFTIINLSLLILLVEKLSLDLREVVLFFVNVFILLLIARWIIHDVAKGGA